MVLSFFQYKLTAIYIILESMYMNICHNVCDPKGYHQRSLWIRLYSDWKYRRSGECISNVNVIQSFFENIA